MFGCGGLSVKKSRTARRELSPVRSSQRTYGIQQLISTYKGRAAETIQGDNSNGCSILKLEEFFLKEIITQEPHQA